MSQYKWFAVVFESFVFMVFSLAFFALSLASASENGYYLVSTWQKDFTGSPSTDGSADVLNEFFSSQSLGSGGKEGAGIDRAGNYVVNGTVVKRYGLGQTVLTDPQTEVRRWPLTFAAGHPYYSACPSGPQAWGKLQGGDWKSFVAQVPAVHLDLKNTSDEVLARSVLVVESLSPGHLPVVLSGFKHLSLLGLVVRKSGVLLIDDEDLDLRVHFITVESGGLLQAGSHHDDDYRFQSKLTITLVHSDDYASTPVTASQYSKEMLHPGVTMQGPGSDFTDFAGGKGHNWGGTKCVLISFNGNLQLNGAVPALVEYKNTWTAAEHDSSGAQIKDWDVEIAPLTTGNNSLWPGAYPMVWARLRTPGALRGSTTIALELLDFNAQSVLQGRTWHTGDQILITTKTSQFTDSTQAIGMPRVWMNHPEGSADNQANTEANLKFKPLLGGNKDGEVGVEVATIAGLDSNGVITLQRPLVFDHVSSDVELRNEKGRILNVRTRLHVGWLSRRIIITSLRSSGGGGCNGLPSTTPNPINGPQGQVVPNIGKGSESNEVYARCYANVTDTAYVGPEPPDPNPRGHWMFGTTNLTGCNSIWGGQVVFRYGSSGSLDGTELTGMGMSGNFGLPGQYAVHFHLAGFAKSFRDYLPALAKDQDWSRELRVVNCAIWRAYMRWITVHGASEVEIRNNVGFLTYGSGYFVEDGTEIHNIFDHNMGIMALTAVRNAYWNPSPIYPIVSTDYGPMSVFWFKNNMNIFTRNVMAHCPTPVIGVWYVPQRIGKLRGPSSICIGSELLGLPALASEDSGSILTILFLIYIKSLNRVLNHEKK